MDSGKSVGGRGVVGNKFIINFHDFPGGLVLDTILKYWLRFLNEYEAFETVEPGDREEALLGAAVEA